MKKKGLSFPVLLGAALIVIGLGGMLALFFGTRLAGHAARETAGQIALLLPERTAGIARESGTAEMPVLELDGRDYCALLEVSAYGVKLPVGDVWEDARILSHPCRFYGSAYEENLILGGSNQEGQFGFCTRLDLGDTLTLTDMTGCVFRYRVSRIDRSSSADAERLMEGQWALTLFLRDRYDRKFILVRCEPA